MKVTKSEKAQNKKIGKEIGNIVKDFMEKIKF